MLIGPCGSSKNSSHTYVPEEAVVTIILGPKVRVCVCVCVREAAGPGGLQSGVQSRRGVRKTGSDSTMPTGRVLPL